MSKPKQVNQLLNNSSRQIQYIVKRAHLLKKINVMIHEHLDPSFHDKCFASNYERGTITITAINTSIATRLRFLVADLLEKIKQNPEFNDALSIQCRVQKQLPQAKEQEGKKIVHRELSSKTKQSISKLLRGMSDSRLTRALKSLIG
ncbi:MAG: DciA family protein [Gammaproteobacteria bacterium]